MICYAIIDFSESDPRHIHGDRVPLGFVSAVITFLSFLAVIANLQYMQ